jgi:hypothetical protein
MGAILLATPTLHNNSTKLHVRTRTEAVVKYLGH